MFSVSIRHLCNFCVADLSRQVKAIIQVIGAHDQPGFIRRKDDVEAELFKGVRCPLWPSGVVSFKFWLQIMA